MSCRRNGIALSSPLKKTIGDAIRLNVRIGWLATHSPTKARRTKARRTLLDALGRPENRKRLPL
ncbi:hypothetical protein Pmar_PMAR004532 [Perkinsus marinus ATCC 50983]|uniref:Uncharacterized protein n=1 Tax=Perkinsus marinus (strain ATCC 50983 / TXsc) TaxID=423536 RepID=C5LZX4_PERM5|nr:hypothetical protein Pmar_PMAR004532 [Perkinsus marinus ATCC 50983]EEQ97792.1 hypothetical protein Pmar_PMAR004532 [Perkinsus marinus ATCC 50983]|eukprot:XP_002765075.1 hypothetical protein Pmar_PMAR004532 [Perkinsus marinus ATCC 50983]